MAQFITLTYDTSKVPISRNGFMSLDKRHCQLFFKRLRKAQFGNSRSDIRYFLAGEYGGISYRPHYHALLFNAKQELIAPAWDLGHCHYGEVNEASVGYTLKYMMKKKRIPLHVNDDRIPEFSLMSKRLGSNYLTDAVRKWHLNALEERMYIPLSDGKKIAMPRYFKDKLYTPEQREQIALACYRKMSDDFVKNQDDMIFRYGLEGYHQLMEELIFAKSRALHNVNTERNKI